MLLSFSYIRKWSQCSFSIPMKSQAFSLFQRLWKTTFDPKWVNNLITFQEINLHPSKDWLNSKVFFTSDKVCSKYDFFFNKGNVYTWLIKLQILLEIFFPEDNLIRFEILKVIWYVPGKNNNNENNNYTTFLNKFFCLSFYWKMGWTRWLQLGRGVSNTMSNKSYIL